MRNTVRLIIALMFLSVTANAQWRWSPYNYSYYGTKDDSLHILPKVLANPSLLESGAIRWNTTSQRLQVYNGSAWIDQVPGSSAITNLNGLTSDTQTFATGTTGTDFNISSSGSTHTFNIPDASTTARGLVTTGFQTFTGSKVFANNISIQVVPNQGSAATKFLTLNNDVVNYRTPAQVLSDIGAAPATTSTSYIHNSTTAQTADYNITGNGTIGGNLTTTGVGTFGAVTTNTVTATGIMYSPRLNSGQDDKSLSLDGGNSSGAIGSSIVLRGGTYASTPGEMSFHTGTGTGSLQPERMRIDATGKVGIGTTTPAYPLDVTGNIRGTDTVKAKIFRAAGAATDLYMQEISIGPTKRSGIVSNNLIYFQPQSTTAAIMSGTQVNIGVPLFIASGLQLNTTTVVGDTTLTTNNTTAFVKNVGTITIALPTPNLNSVIIIKKVSAAGNDVIITPPAGFSIEGGTSFTLQTQNASVILQGNGTDNIWRIMGAYSGGTSGAL